MNRALRLGKLIALYDDNGISIDGHIKGWFTDDTPKRFEAYGWHVISGIDGHDVDAVDRAIADAKLETDRPTLICCRTVIGKGSPNKADSHDSHGSPLGAAEIAATRSALGWAHEPFEVPDDVRTFFDARSAGVAAEADWDSRFAKYKHDYPELAAEFVRRMSGALPSDFEARARAGLDAVIAGAQTIASRKASQNAITAFAADLPELIGGSADLASSNLTLWDGARGAASEGGGNYVYYGVREFGMAAIMNGLVRHGGLRPFGGTFLMFSEYARNALRMAALMKLNPIYVFTHDSIALGQDGPTHQPVEQLATLRLMPNMDVWRPCDTTETYLAWQAAIESRATPTSLILSRQNLAFQDRDESQLADVMRGGYVLKREAGRLAAVLIATGSEVQIAVAAAGQLAGEGLPVRVVSMPSTFRFDRQPASYRADVLGTSVPRIAIEAGVPDYWRKYVGLEGDVVGIETFGESAPAEILFEHFGLTAEHVANRVRVLVDATNSCGAEC